MQTYKVTKDELYVLKNLANAAAKSHFITDSQTITRASEIIVSLFNQPEQPPVPKEKIDQMVTRFLGWKLPADFAPDGGITFNQIANPHMFMADQYKREPIGTNLFTADQAKAMFEYVLETPK